MRTKRFNTLRNSPIKSLLAILVVGIAIFNFFAYSHASAMLRFSHTGERTSNPESLTIQEKVQTLLTGVSVPKPRNSVTPQKFDLDFETHRIQVNDQVELEAWHIPHAQSKGIILMFHGYAASKASLLLEADLFHQMGYEIFLVDFRGSGGSNQNNTSIGYLEADDVSAAFHYVESRWNKTNLYLYGHSMGSVSILRAISEYDIQPDAIIVETVFDRMLSTVRNRFILMGVPSFPSAHALVFWGGVINGHSGFSHNPVDYAPNVKCPTLMLHGEEDRLATPEEARAVFERIASDEKYFKSFSETGHGSYAASKPKQWKRAVGQFLNQQRKTKG